MKHISIVLLAFLISQNIFSQKYSFTELNSLNRLVTTSQHTNSNDIIIWSDDFSKNENWTISNIEGNSQNWKLTTYAPIGMFSGSMGKIESETPYKFALIDSDFIGNGEDLQRAKLTSTQTINCSANEKVFVKFHSYYGKLESKIFFKISNNNGDSWTEYEIHKETLDMQITNNSEIIRLDITEQAAGYENVLVQFYFDGLDTNWGIAWMVDDIAVYEPIGLNAEIVSLNNYLIMGTSEQFESSLTIQNLGAETINSITYKYKLNDFESQIETKENLSIKSFETFRLKHNELYSFENEGNFKPSIEITQINGMEYNLLATGDYIEVYENIGNKALLCELFTSSTCAPCSGFNPFFDMIQSFVSPTILNTVKYQMNWPDNGDLYYTNEGGERRDFYNINSVPSLYINGEEIDIYNYGLDLIRNSLKQPSSLAINMNGNITKTIVDATIDLTSIENINDVHIFVSVNEKQTHDNTGTNGEIEFNHVMMKMLTTSNGIAIDELLINETKTFTYSFDMSTTNMEEVNDLEIVAFVQNKNSKEVIQTATIDLSWRETTSNRKEEMETNVNIYPNPATEYFLINTDFKSEVSIYSITGELILKIENYISGNEINLSAFPNGTYLVTIVSGYNIDIKKLFIIR